MHIAKQRQVLVIAIITACASATALWPAGAGGHATLPRSNYDSANAVKAPILSHPVAIDNLTRQRANEAYGKLPLSFEANQGQTDARVKFLSRGEGYNLFLTSTEAVLSLEARRGAGEKRGAVDSGSARVTNGVVRMKLVGANSKPKIEGADELTGKTNYFIGKDPKKWRVNVPTFASVHYQEVYPGVDAVYYGNQRQLENDFIVAPGTNPGVIRLGYEGAKKISINNEGNLVLSVLNGDVQLQKPVIYQLIDGVRREVAGNYIMRKQREVGFEVAAYDLTKPLVIDPVLIYSTFLGGNRAEEDWAITVDASGNAYVIGTTASTDFPGATPPQHGFDDVTVVKFNATGSALIYSTYLGGSQTESGYDIAVDSGGDAYVTGKTTSADFPVLNAFKSTYSGGTDEDAFVTRLNSTGSALVYSTYLAGQFGARGWGIAASSSQGFAYVTGTTSVNFPVTAGAFESTNFNSGFMTKLCTNCSGASSMVYSTFLAHTGSGEGRSIAADVSGNVYLTGKLFSNSANFATPGAFQTTYGGGAADAFVAKFNTNLAGAAALVYATYLGGSGKDTGGNDTAGGSGRAIAIDASGNAYITGSTGSTNFPLANPSQGAIGGQNDAFLTKLNAAGTALIYSTYLGGNGDDFGRSVAVNVGGGAYVTGEAGPNFPTTNSLPTPSASVGFVTKFTPAGEVVYSTLLSGVTASTGSFGIAVDSAGNAFATGGTNANIVTTAGAFQTDIGLGGTVGWVTAIADPTIIGRVLDEDGNSLAGATVILNGVPNGTTTTDANGGYTFGLLSTGNNYTVAVIEPGYIFNSQAANNLQKNVRLDFGPALNSISGKVTFGANGLSGVAMTLSGGKPLVTNTDAVGNYSFGLVPAGRNYTVTPAFNLFQFTPPSLSFDNLSTNQTANFVATAAPIIFFSPANYNVAENAGGVTLTVTRTGDTTGTSIVNYASSDTAGTANCNVFNGVASSRCDYTGVVGTLTFAAGETTKSITVPIIDDSYAEGNETFSVTLTSVTGAVLGTATATVTIIDNEAVNGVNPVDNKTVFIRQQYLDFLGREPDAGGLAFYLNILNGCVATDVECNKYTRGALSANFFRSPEFQRKGSYVMYLYMVSLGQRPATVAELNNTNKINRPHYSEFITDLASISDPADDPVVGEAKKVAFTNAWMLRSEIQTLYPSILTNAQFVQTLMDTAGITTLSIQNQLVTNLTAGTITRAQALRSVVESAEINAKFYKQAFVTMEYFGYLRRDPEICVGSADPANCGYIFHNSRFQLAGDPDFLENTIVRGFIESPEYRGRFGP